MSSRPQAITIIIYSLLIVFNLPAVQASCDFSEFTPPQNLTEYHAFTSITKLQYAPDGNPPDDAVNFLGYFGQIGGVNKNGTIYLIGGVYNWRAGGVDGTLIHKEPLKWYWSINAYDSYIAYDESVDISLNITTIQSHWMTSLYTRGYLMPDITRPADISSPTYIGASGGDAGSGGFYCDIQCSTYLNNQIFIIHPTIISQTLGTSLNWPIMIIFDMNDAFPLYYTESQFTSIPPNNYWINGPNDTIPFDIVRLRDGGCTTHNNTHIFHFSWAVNDVRYYHYPTTYAYHPPTDTWSLLTGNPYIKFHFTCAPEVTGRFIYLLAGSETHVGLFGGDPVYATDKYDTWTDSFTRLASTGDYPEIFGREGAISVLDSSTNSIIVTAGRIYENDCTSNCYIVVKKVEIFRCETEDWFVPLDTTDELYFDIGTKGSAMVTVNDFVPNGQISNASADVIFVMGGGYASKARNDIQFISILTEREYYPNHVVRIEGLHPDDEAIEFTSFDPWQRFELAFRIVITDGVEYEIDELWNISFTIDNKSVSDLNEEFDTQILMRPACQCWGKNVPDTNEKLRCENVAENVKQVTIVELMIPSRRTLHNGYCVDKNASWIFSYDRNSTITVTATNGLYSHSMDFEFEFMRIEMLTLDQTTRANITRGCKVTNESHGALTHFAIRCDAYFCEKCPKFESIGRGYNGIAAEWFMNEIAYNILMNDVLLSPDAYIRQDFKDESVIGTESLNTDTLIAVIRARTAIGTWYQECFYNFTYEWTKNWKSLNSILNQTTNEALWNDVIDKLNSENNEDIVAAYSILQEIVIEEEVPDGEDPVAEISNALSQIMNRMNAKDENVTIDDITSNLALVDLLTSDSDLVAADIVLNISSVFLPSVLEKTLLILNDSEADYEAGVLADTVQNVGQLANSAATNLLNVSNLTETVRQEVVHDVQQIMTTGLTGSWEGEALILVRDGSKTKGYTLKKDEACEMDDISVKIPQKNAATSSDTLKCVITTTNEDELAIDLFDGSGTRVFTTNDSCLPYFITMNLPDDYKGLNDDIYERVSAGDWHNASHQFPTCTFWNRSDEEWSARGCFVYKMDADSITCACTHLTTFKISAEDFDPKAELLTAKDARQLTIENIQRHSTTWVTMIMIVVVLFLACICVPNNNADRPLIAFEDIIYKEFRDQYLHKHQQWHEIQQIDRWYGKIEEHKREISRVDSHSEMNASSGVFGVGVQSETPRSPSSSASNSSIRDVNPFASATFEVKNKSTRTKYYCLLSVNLFRTYLKNDHIVLSVFQRSDGTNFSTKQRIGLFLLYMYLIMMADAVFYGSQQDRRPMGELTASALISLFATFPVYLIRKLFVWSKPIVVKSARKLPIIKDPTNDLTVADTKEIEMAQTTETNEESVSAQVKKDEELRARRERAEADEQKRVSAQYWSDIAKLKRTKRPDMKLVRECMHYVNTKALASEKATLAHDIRLILLNYNYPFANWYKKVAWVILIIMAVVCITTSVIYGIRFDIRADELAIEVENHALLLSQLNNITNDSNQCWNMSMELVAESRVIHSQIVDIKEEQARIESLMDPYSDDFEALFGDAAIYDSTKWLLNVLISFLASVFLWQPASIYFVTWLKIWAFHNGFVMEFSYPNLAMFLANYLCCCCICGGFSKRKKKGTVVSSTSQMDRTQLTTAVGDTAGIKTVRLETITAAVVDEECKAEISVTDLPSGSRAPGLCTGLGFEMLLDDDSEFQILSLLCDEDFFLCMPDDEAVELQQFAYD